MKNTDTAVTLPDIESLALKESNISSKVKQLQSQQIDDVNIQTSLNEAISIMEQSLEAVKKKMYGDFGDHSSLTTTAAKVQQMKEILEGQLKEASEQIKTQETQQLESTLTHLEESLQTGEEDIIFAQNKLKSRTTSLCKEGLAFEVRQNLIQFS